MKSYAMDLQIQMDWLIINTYHCGLFILCIKYTFVLYFCHSYIYIIYIFMQMNLLIINTYHCGLFIFCVLNIHLYCIFVTDIFTLFIFFMPRAKMLHCVYNSLKITWHRLVTFIFVCEFFYKLMEPICREPIVGVGESNFRASVFMINLPSHCAPFLCPLNSSHRLCLRKHKWSSVYYKK